MSDGKDIPGTAPVEVDLSTARYFAAVPKRYHDTARFHVDRTVFLDLASPTGHQDARVYEIATEALVWRSKIAKSLKGQRSG